MSYKTVASNRPKKFIDNLYEKDRAPYYSPSRDDPSKILLNSNSRQEKFLTPIELKDLSDIIATEENKRRIEKDINEINNNNNINKDFIYNRDPQAYYDPTLKSKEDKKNELKSALEQVKLDLITKEPEFTEENFKVRQKVQNFRNLNFEKDNKYISENLWSSTKGFESKFFFEFFLFYFFCFRK